MAGANVKNYLSNENSSFFSLEDVDDDEFLKNSRNSNLSTQSNHYGRGYNALEERKLQLMQQKERIEAESLESTQRSLRLLQESEDIGISTAEELQKQREQLERTDRNLDSINSTLRYTQKKIDGFKSVFSSIKNYLTKKSDGPSIPGVSKDTNSASTGRTYFSTERKDASSGEEHPALKLRSSDDNPVELLSVNDRIDQNLDYMYISVKNIKGLALNLGEEIESQNDLIDRIMDKSDRADITLNKQCKEMNKLIKKK